VVRRKDSKYKEQVFRRKKRVSSFTFFPISMLDILREELENIFFGKYLRLF
jgi:hypothetical protein